MASKIRIVKQRDLKDCGCACLLSIIRYYGGNVSMEQLRIDTKTNQQGTTAYNLVETSKKYGFDSVGYKIDNLQDKNIILPCIAHINKNGLEHFIVIYKIEKTKLIVMDPAVGKKIINNNEFYEYFDGVILTFYPRTKIINIKNNNNLLTFIFKILNCEKKLLLNIYFINFLFIIFTLISSSYIKIGLEYSNNYLLIVIIAYIFITICKIVFNYEKEYLKQYLDKNLDVYLFRHFLMHIFKLPSKIIKSRTNGEIITRINELNNIKGLFSEIFVNFILDISLTLLTCPILFSFNKNLFLILCISLLIYALIGILSSKVLYQKVLNNINLEDKFNTVLLDNINCIESIKNLDVTNEVLNKIEQNTSDYIYDKFKISKFIVKLEQIKNSITEICIVVINSIGFYLIVNNKLSVINLVIFNSLMSYFLDPLKNIINCLPKYYYLKASFIKINEFLSIKKEDEKVLDIKLENYDIDLNNITFSYDDFHNTINNYSLKIYSKEKIMLWGKSGTGKSTICKIISGLENVSKGNVLLGNTNYKDLSLNFIRKKVTYISQYESLYNDTIKNNILFYRDIPFDYFNKILKACFIDEIIENRPLRYETYINTDSNNLSGGEKQRIILARACLNEFNILILDEALSEVDTKLERKIIANIKEIFKDKTIIYVSHKDHRQLFDKVYCLGDKN